MTKCNHRSVPITRRPTLFGDGCTYPCEVRICPVCAASSDPKVRAAAWLGMGDADSGLVVAAFAVPGQDETDADDARRADATIAAIASHQTNPEAALAYLEPTDPSTKFGALSAQPSVQVVETAGSFAAADLLPQLTIEERAELAATLDGIPQGEPEPVVEDAIEPLADTVLPDGADEEATGVHEKIDDRFDDGGDS